MKPKPATCPCCTKPVLRVERQTSVIVYWHEIGTKPSQRWGCAVSVRTNR